MKFIGVIAVLSFLVAGSVSVHAAELGLDCPEDNTYTPSPPQMLNKNVTPYTYTPISKPPPKAEVVAVPSAVPVVYAPPPITAPYVSGGVWTYEALNKIGYLGQLALWQLWNDLDGDGDYTVVKGAEKIFNKYGVDGLCYSTYEWIDGDCVAASANMKLATKYYPVESYPDPVERADLAIADYYAYSNWALTAINPSIECYKEGICEPPKEITWGNK